MTTKMCIAGICSQLHARMIRWKIHILLFMVLHSSVFASVPRKEELHYTTLQLIRKNGYPAEAHSVTTEDGYILEMHRIPYSFKAPVMNSKAVVFLMHGLSASSIDWIIMGPKRSLGYLLADAGYDVWLGNNRGNTYSKKHKSISPKSKKFWDFSWHEIGIYDLPAQIDYILRKTQQQSVYYVGMSMGNTVFFVLAAEKPEYNQKIKLSIALAPVVFMKYITSPLLRNVEFVLNLLPLLGEEFVHGKNFISTIGKNACGSRIGRFLCSKFQVMASGSGDDANQLNHEMIPMIASNYPAGCPIKSILHYKQLVHSGKFQKYDYEECNMAKYNQMTPPEYNLTAITCPVAILYADNDGFSDPKDVLRLHRILRNVVNLYRIPWPNFGHFGFIYAKDIKALVNDEILQIDLILKNGYPAEVHSVTTTDGYILEMHRIPYSPKAASTTNKPAVFLLHGLTSSSYDWISMGPGRSLGYLLADAGYDVWMGNNRGNRYSRKHNTLSPRNKKFWDFSWHEMGIYDAPAQIDYILNSTKLQSVYYVGMSMGNTIFFVFASEKPEYNDKIKLSIALAPVVYMGNTPSPVANNAYNEVTLRIFQLLGLEEVTSSGSLINAIGSRICGNKIAKALCENFIFAGSGYDPKQLDSSMLPMVFSHFPTSASLKTFRHYNQMVHSGKFRKYDYGRGNMLKYNQTIPPEYNLSSITAPVGLFYADNDGFSHPKDVLQLRRVLRNVVEVYRVPWPTFGHFGYVFAKDVKTLVNDEVMKLIREH